MQDLIYIHGFNSSPQSQKAQDTARWLANHHPSVRLHVPTLSYDPEAALLLLLKTVERCGSVPGLIGSSMGGFYATVLAERFGLRAALINPAVHPHRLLAHYLGENRNYHTGESYVLEPRHVDILKAQEVTHISHPERLWVLLQTADETLDYRQAVAYYAGCPQDIFEGGSHAYDNYVERLPEIYAFLKMSI